MAIDKSLVRDALIKARRPTICTWCSGPIHKGEQHHFIQRSTGRGFTTARFHVDCSKQGVKA